MKKRICSPRDEPVALKCPRCKSTDVVIRTFGTAYATDYYRATTKGDYVSYTMRGETEFQSGDDTFEEELVCEECGHEEDGDDSQIEEVFRQQLKPNQSLRAINVAQRKEGQK